jgi:hypothetical protein
MNTFREKFGEDKIKFKAYVKDLRKYNDILEQVLIVMAKTIKSDFIGKPINKVFTNKLTKIIGSEIVSFEVETSDYTNEKSIRIELSANGITYKFDCGRALFTYITFYHNETNGIPMCTEDNRFTEESVNAIIAKINHSRVVVATYEDAAKNLNKYIKKYEKAVNTYVRTMENINSIFADTSRAQDMSYQCSGVKNIELWKWDNEFKKGVEMYVLK